MQNVLAVFLGGGAGAVLRYLTGVLALRYLSSVNLPAATFAVNIAGCFILGVLFAVFVDRPEVNTSLKLALTAGFCGGLTTFSTFSFEMFEMLKNAQYLQVSVYLILSLAAGLAAVWIGVSCAKFV